MKIVMDTNAYTGFVRGDSKIFECLQGADQIILPAPVVGELLYGFRGGSRAQRNRQQLNQFLARPVAHFAETNREVCERYALVFHQLKQKGKPIPTNDIWIAAHALALGADLLSSDRHFAAVDGLSWIVPGE